MLVLNEFWCGDGAQILPVHEAMTRVEGASLEVKVLLRDEYDRLQRLKPNSARSLRNGARMQYLVSKTANACKQAQSVDHQVTQGKVDTVGKQVASV